MLKWQFQPDRRSGSWAGTIVEHRRRIRDAISESPSLQPYFEQIFAEAYAAAVKQASAETQLSSFPDSCPYSPLTVLNDE